LLQIAAYRVPSAHDLHFFEVPALPGREISKEEGQRLLRIVRRSSGSVVMWGRAQMVLLSAGDQEDRVGYIAWRNRHADNQALRELVKRANVA
jgi:hypothetical protein